MKKKTMIKNLLLIVSFLITAVSSAAAQALESRHDPKFDSNLSPTQNGVINPEKNSNINPRYNWNINPAKNNDVNPLDNSTINPLNHFELNPDVNKSLNPMYHNEYHPRNPSWKGLYLFNKSDELIGYVSVATQQLMLCFDSNGEWTGFFVRASNSSGIYNFFDVKGVWTGKYLCFDSMAGYNLFDRDGNWTGQHVK